MVFKIVYGIVLFIIGIGVLLYGFNLKNDFMLGFGSGLTVVAIIFSIKNITIMFNKDKMKKLEIQENDERNIKIINCSYAITFRISIILEALACLILTIYSFNNLSIYVSYIICAQIVIYIISYIIISKKI